MAVEGILVIDKPAGWTSFDVVRFVRGRCGEKRVGHAGTLDPAATGVLPVMVGRATRLIEYLVDSTKAYEAVVELGLVTDTYDFEGDVTARADASQVTREAVAGVLDRFRGELLQTPPIFSALKRDGVPLYKRARRGEVVEVEERPARVDELYVTDWSPPRFGLHIECAKGFYVRSLAHDIGQALGVGGVLAGLRRSRVGPFALEDAVDIESLRADFERDDWRRHVIAPDEVLLHWDAAILNADNALRLANGQRVILGGLPAGAATAEGPCRAYSAEGDFLGVTSLTGSGALVPHKMFSP